MRRAGLDRSTLVVAGVAAWQWIFVVNIPIAPAVALLLAERARRRVERPSAARPDHGGSRVPRSSAA